MNSETIDTIEKPIDEVNLEIIYPSLMERVKAMMTDIVFGIILMILFSYIFSSMENVSDMTRKIAFVFVVALYDPLSVAFIGGTPGHLINNLKVRRSSNHQKNVNILVAFLRYGIKAILGVVSFLTIS